MEPARHPASFRDRSGFIYRDRRGTVRRVVNPSYRADYDLLMSSGLYDRLVEDGLLIEHREVKGPRGAYRTLEPTQLPFISYPYEWSFSQLQDAALATLEVQRIALEYGMTLKDASAYNIQFYQGRPVLIDTLSFEKYQSGQPWVAYRQFCQHFLAPLALMAYTDVRLNRLSQVYIDGVPLDLAVGLLPRRAKIRPGLLLHLSVHAGAQRRFEGAGTKPAKRAKSRRINVPALVSSLHGTVEKLSWKSPATEWGEYYSFTNYSDRSFREKGKLVRTFTTRVKPKSVWDIGGNTGAFSRIASDAGIATVCFDIDPVAVEKNYQETRRREETALLPLFLDLTNPSPGIGWDNAERTPALERGPADLVYFLAIVHHLAIGNNVPLPAIAANLAKVGRHVIFEWVPKTDSKVRQLLASRDDIFDDYAQGELEKALKIHFAIRSREQVPGSKRVLYLLKSK